MNSYIHKFKNQCVSNLEFVGDVERFPFKNSIPSGLLYIMEGKTSNYKVKSVTHIWNEEMGN